MRNFYLTVFSLFSSFTGWNRNLFNKVKFFSGLSLQQPRSQRMDHVLNLYQPNNSHLINTTTNQQLQQNSQSASNNLVLMSQGSGINCNKNSSVPLAMEVDPTSTSSISSLISHSLTNNHSRTRAMGGGIYPSSLLNVPQSLLNSSNNGSRTSQSLMNSSFAPTSLPLDLGGVQNVGLVPGAVELHPMHSYQAHHTSSGSASFVPHTVGSNSNNGSNNPADSDESPMVGVCVQQSPVVIH